MMNTSVDNRCEKTGFIKICPKMNDRIVCNGHPIVHKDNMQSATLKMN